MQAFLTGSRVYGTPRGNSDTDLVVYLPPRDGGTLVEHVGGDSPLNGGTNDSGGPDTGSNGLVVGRLNLIVVSDPAWYEAWRQGTETLSAARPVTRDQAIATFKTLFDLVRAEHQLLTTSGGSQGDAVLRIVRCGADADAIPHLPAVADWLEEFGCPLYAAGFRRLSRTVDADAGVPA